MCSQLSHNNGFSYPVEPTQMDWSPHFPHIENPYVNVNTDLLIYYSSYVVIVARVVRHLDIGCGYGGLTVALAKLYPDKLVLGLEIRAKIVEYVKLKIEALRNEANDMVSLQNASCFRTNCQRYLPNYFRKGQVSGRLGIRICNLRGVGMRIPIIIHWYLVVIIIFSLKRFLCAFPILTLKSKIFDEGLSVIRCCQSTPIS